VPQLPDDTPTLTRGARRRERTRGQLLQAARALFAHQGVDATTIAEITEAADVGFGSFYNHFASKDEVLEAVLIESTDEQGLIVDALTAELEDPAEVVSVAHRHFVRRAGADPDWAGLIVRLDSSHRVMTRALGDRARRDLRRGITAGRFTVADARVALVAMGGALTGVMQAVLNKELGREADVRHAEGLLRLLGLTPQDAAEVARRRMSAVPIPALPMPARS
jgi:AcrR family transcriptional regulator